MTPAPVAPAAITTPWPVVIVAACALLFTVGSFWWINARRGRLRSFPPASYAASMTDAKLIVCLPLVLFNTGAVPIVVLLMRLRFPDAPPTTPPIPWQNSRDKLPPDPSEKSLAAGFAVAGRTATQGYFEFSRDSPGFLPRGKAVRVAVEAKLGHKANWRPLVEFTLNTEKISDPVGYLAWGNDPAYE